MSEGEGLRDQRGRSGGLEEDANTMPNLILLQLVHWLGMLKNLKAMTWMMAQSL